MSDSPETVMAHCTWEKHLDIICFPYLPQDKTNIFILSGSSCRDSDASVGKFNEMYTWVNYYDYYFFLVLIYFLILYV